jgi:heme b synthase
MTHASHGRDSKPNPNTLRLVFWETTVACNLECVHCRRLEVAAELARNDLTHEEGLRLIDQIAEVGSPILVFSGGEPLMRPDVFELAAHARSRGLRIALASNGTMVNRALAQRISEAAFERVSVSLDGACAQTHDAFRRQIGSFDLANNALRLLKAAGVATQLNCTIARHNQHELADVLRLGESLGADAVHYFLLVPVGCGEQIADDQMLSANEIETRLSELQEMAQQTELEIKATCAPHYYRIVRQKGVQSRREGRPQADARRGGHHPMTKGCLAGTAVCFVSHQGRVFPCGYLPVSAGNVRTDSFADIWHNSELFAKLRDTSLLTGKCGACEYRNVCGGCRARAFYQYGDYLDEEPFCAYEPVRTRETKTE